MLTGFRCPPSAPTAGQTNNIRHCLGACPHRCAAPGLLAAIYKTDTENHHVGTYISASMLSGSGCPRQTVFERFNDFYELPNRRFWSFRGTHAHGMVERAGDMLDEFGWMNEMRMRASLTYPDLPLPIFDAKGEFTGQFDMDKPLVVELGGTCDSYNPVLKELWDMKSMADAKAEMMVTGSKPGTYSPHLEDSWVKQLNVYRWLISKSPITKEVRKQLKAHGFKLDGEFLPAPEYLGIQGISMMNIPRTGAKYALSRAKRGVTMFDVAPVPVWPLEETENFIRDEAIKWYRWLVLRAPTDVVPKDKKWLCDSCAFNGERFPEGPCHPSAERELKDNEILLEE